MASDIPDFYREQWEIVNKSSTIREMKSKYDRFLWAYLQKSFEEWTDKWLLEVVKANWDNINFRIFLDYLLKNNPEKLSNDDLYLLDMLIWALDFVSNTSSFFSKEFANVGYEVSKSVK